MPELPEVETVRRGLAQALAGARVTRVKLARADLRFPFPQGFVERLQGARILALERRAKFLLAPLDSGETWVTHLGMTGRFSLWEGGQNHRPGDFYYAKPPDPKHTHVELELEGGTVLAYNDVRRFGFMDMISTEALPHHPWFAGLGPEPLGPGFTPKYLAAALAGRSQAIKPALLDQGIVAGLGNIYACEALYASGISPLRAANAVSAAAVRTLTGAIRAVLEASIEVGGSTLRDYAGADGAPGAFQNAFQAYGRANTPCLRSNCPGTIERTVQAGRASFFCPACQR